MTNDSSAVNKIDWHQSVQRSHDQAEQRMTAAFYFKDLTSGSIRSLSILLVRWIEYKSKFAILEHLCRYHQLAVEELVAHSMLLEDLCEENDNELYDSELILIQSSIFQWR